MHYFSRFAGERKTKWAPAWSDRESSPRSKRFRLFSEQRRGTGFSPREKWNEMYKGEGRGRKEISFRSFTRAMFGALFDSRSSPFSPKQHGNACHAGYKERSGEKNGVIIFFFCCSLFSWGRGYHLPPLAWKLERKKEETNKGEAHPKNVGTELEHSRNSFRFPVCFAIDILGLTHPPTPKKKTLR